MGALVATLKTSNRITSRILPHRKSSLPERPIFPPGTIPHERHRYTASITSFRERAHGTRTPQRPAVEENNIPRVINNRDDTSQLVRTHIFLYASYYRSPAPAIARTPAPGDPRQPSVVRASSEKSREKKREKNKRRDRDRAEHFASPLIDETVCRHDAIVQPARRTRITVD